MWFPFFVTCVWSGEIQVSPVSFRYGIEREFRRDIQEDSFHDQPLRAFFVETYRKYPVVFVKGNGTGKLAPPPNLYNFSDTHNVALETNTDAEESAVRRRVNIHRRLNLWAIE